MKIAEGSCFLRFAMLHIKRNRSLKVNKLAELWPMNIREENGIIMLINYNTGTSDTTMFIVYICGPDVPVL